jgi:hypothetical protein
MADDFTPDTRFEGSQPARNSADEFAGLGRTDERRPLLEQIARGEEGEDEGNSLMGWLIFILIFGVGNVILYATTGIFLIPIPRR